MIGKTPGNPPKKKTWENLPSRHLTKAMGRFNQVIANCCGIHQGLGSAGSGSIHLAEELVKNARELHEYQVSKKSGRNRSGIWLAKNAGNCSSLEGKPNGLCRNTSSCAISSRIGFLHRNNAALASRVHSRKNLKQIKVFEGKYLKIQQNHPPGQI
jgi:hypothetical protein